MYDDGNIDCIPIVAQNDTSPISSIIELTSTDTLAEADKNEIISLKNEFVELFKNDFCSKPTSIVKHSIQLKDATPFFKSPYRLPYRVTEFVEQEITSLLKNNFIRRSTSPFSSPALVVPKKNGNLRLCIDYRLLNSNTIQQPFPIPNIDILLDSLTDATIFSKLDLKSGFWQIAMEESSIQYTAFSTTTGHYEWLVMPFGLCGAPFTFQRLMNIILSEYIGKFLVVYIDDILIFSKTRTEHLEHLFTAFHVLNKASLKLNEEKLPISTEMGSLSNLNLVILNF